MKAILLLSCCGLFVLSSCSSKPGYQNTFPLPSYVKINNGDGNYVPYPTDPQSVEELNIWSQSWQKPLQLSGPQPPAKSGKPVQLQSDQVTVSFYPGVTEIQETATDGTQKVTTRSATAADTRLRNHLIKK